MAEKRNRREFLFLSKRQKQRRLVADKQYKSEVQKVETNELSSSLSALESSSSFNPEIGRSICSSNECLNNENSEILISASSDSDLSSISFNFETESDLYNVSFKNSAMSLEEDLRSCFVKHHATHSLINSILSILSKHGHPNLPADSRTLMKTPRHYNNQIISIDPGNYIHIGLASNFNRIISQYVAEIPSVIHFNVNIDGLPIAKSSGSQLWPILGDIIDIPSQPFIIGLYHGLSKPGSCDEFLRLFVEEYISLEQNPLIINKKTYLLRLNCIIADTPAKAFITNTKGHTAYYGCSKCICKGKYLEKVIFPEMNAPLRTNESFRNRTNSEHHKSNDTTVLESLDIDMIKQIPLDYMHLVLLGVTKKLVSMWVKGNIQVRLKKPLILKLDDKHLKLKEHVPLEFCRKPRSVLDVERWKATEFRLFLLYTGPIILKSVLSKEAYNHFLSLSVSIRLLCSKNLTPANIDYANSLLQYFVKKFKYFYGESNRSFNVHNLIHLADDAKNHGSLDLFSAFKFESYMFELKKQLKSFRFPLQQIINRINEKQAIPSAKNFKDKLPRVCRTKGQIKSVLIENFEIKCKEPDCFVLLKNKKYVKIESILEQGNDFIFYGKEFKNSIAFFKSPCDSKILDIVTSDNCLGEDLIEIPLNFISKKCFCAPLNDGCVLIPLLH